MANFEWIKLNGEDTKYYPVDSGAMRYVPTPTANNILLTDSNGQAIDSGVSLASKQNVVLSGTTEPDPSLGNDGDIYIMYTV